MSLGSGARWIFLVIPEASAGCQNLRSFFIVLIFYYIIISFINITVEFHIQLSESLADISFIFAHLLSCYPRWPMLWYPLAAVHRIGMIWDWPRAHLSLSSYFKWGGSHPHLVGWNSWISWIHDLVKPEMCRFVTSWCWLDSLDNWQLNLMKSPLILQLFGFIYTAGQAIEFRSKAGRKPQQSIFPCSLCTNFIGIGYP